MKLPWAAIVVMFLLAVPSLAQEPEKISREAVTQLEERALKLEREKDYREAITLWDRLHSAYPENTEYLFRLGRLYSWTKHWPKAEEHLKRCLELDPDHGDARLALGYLYLWKGNPDSARAQFEEVRKKTAR